MKPQDIYRMKPLAMSKSLTHLVNGNYPHVPEVLDLCYDIDDGKNERVDVAIYFDPPIDYGYCVCTIGAAFFDGCPVMVFAHAGRSGKDQHRRYITDPFQYARMVSYMRSLAPLPHFSVDCGPAEQDQPWLDDFYGYTIDLPATLESGVMTRKK